jgi:hypothetical protein
MSDLRETNGLEWQLTATWPIASHATAAALDGGFFHTPLGVQVAWGRGTPLAATLVRHGRVVGFTLGATTSCRLARRPRHLFLPTMPALAPDEPQGPALRALRGALHAAGVAEVICDAYDGRRAFVPEQGPGNAYRDRPEYVVPLAHDLEAQIAQCHTTHRRQARRGERLGWTLRPLSRAAAGDLLRDVTETAAARRAEAGDQTAAPRLPPLPDETEAPDPRFGAAVFGAFDGAVPLAGGWFGWAGGRMYYVMGGSTEAGYSAGAATWFHMAVMRWFAAIGGSTYNMGGIHAGCSPGLRRFKEGFGAVPTRCCGFRWTLDAGHMGAHRAARAFASALGL